METPDCTLAEDGKPQYEGATSDGIYSSKLPGIGT